MMTTTIMMMMIMMMMIIMMMIIMMMTMMLALVLMMMVMMMMMMIMMMMMMMMLSLPLPECTCSAAVKPIAGEHVTSFAFIQSRLPSHANILGYNVKTEIVELHFEDDAAVQAFIYDACRHGNQRIDTTSACRGQSSTRIRCLLSFT